MAFIMNEHDALEATIRFDDETPNLRDAAATLWRLVEWTNANSDGWPYWSKPSTASKRLQQVLHEETRRYYRGEGIEDISDAALKSLLTPIKSFLTRQGVDWREVV